MPTRGIRKRALMEAVPMTAPMIDSPPPRVSM